MGKTGGSGLRHAVEDGEARAPRAARHDNSQSIVVAFLIGMVLLVLLTLWMRSNLVARIDELQVNLDRMPAKLEPVAKQCAEDATAPKIKELNIKIDVIETRQRGMETDLKALRDEVLMNSRRAHTPEAAPAPASAAPARKPATTPLNAPRAGTGDRLDDAVSNAVGDVP